MCRPALAGRELGQRIESRHRGDLSPVTFRLPQHPPMKHCDCSLHSVATIQSRGLPSRYNLFLTHRRRYMQRMSWIRSSLLVVAVGIALATPAWAATPDAWITTK